MFKKILMAAGLLSLAISSHAAVATTSTYAGTNTVVSNCIPFGCPDAYRPHMGFIYKNVAAFTLHQGDIIAFDTGAKNDNKLSFDLSLGRTTTNGGMNVDGNGLTLVSSLADGIYGDNTVGNYDIAFVVNTTFSFAGGGLIVDFLNTNGAVADGSSEQNLVYATNNPYAVARYYTFSGNRGSDFDAVGNMRIITSDVQVPEPASMALFGLGIAALALRRRSKAA